MYGTKKIESVYWDRPVVYDMENIEDFVSYAIKTSNPRYIGQQSLGGFGYHGNTPIGDTWGIVWSYAPNQATLIDDSNMEQWKQALNELDPDCEYWTIEYFSSWITGTENIMVKLITDNGMLTPIAYLVYELLTRLDQYPILNEDHYNAMEHDASLESIRQGIAYLDRRGIVDSDSLPENIVGLVWESLWDSNVYANEGYFDESEVQTAMNELGYTLADSDSD